MKELWDFRRRLDDKACRNMNGPGAGGVLTEASGYGNADLAITAGTEGADMVGGGDGKLPLEQDSLVSACGGHRGQCAIVGIGW